MKNLSKTTIKATTLHLIRNKIFNILLFTKNVKKTLFSRLPQVYTLIS